MIPEPFTLERPAVDWTRHKRTQAPKILPPPGEVWRTPGGRKQQGRYYTRTTTLADTLEEAFALYGWKVRRAIVGLGQRPDYAVRAASLTMEDHDRDELEALAELCIEAGGPSAALIGSTLHTYTERADRGETLGYVPPELRELVEAWQRITAPLRLEYREVRTVNDALATAGTPDAFGFCSLPDPDGVVDERRVIDLKSGSIKYPAKMSGQLYIYATSDLYDPETGERRPLEVNTRWGLVVHLKSDGTEPPGLWWLNLAHGRRLVELAVPVREWRAVKADDIIRPALVEERVPATPAPGDELVDITERLVVSSERVEPVAEVEAAPEAIACTRGKGEPTDADRATIARFGEFLETAGPPPSVDERLAERRRALELCAAGTHCVAAEDVCGIDARRDDHSPQCCTCHEPAVDLGLASRVVAAGTPRELVALWQQHRDEWTPALDELAAERRAQLDEQQRLERPQAALEAAIATAATLAELLDLWNVYGGPSGVWSHEHDALAAARHRELTEGAVA